MLDIFLNFYMDVQNFCMCEEDKYYVFFNVLKFTKFIVYVKVRYVYDNNFGLLISFNFSQSLFNFVNLLKNFNLLNIESIENFIIKNKENKLRSGSLNQNLLETVQTFESAFCKTNGSSQIAL